MKNLLLGATLLAVTGCANVPETVTASSERIAIAYERDIVTAGTIASRHCARHDRAGSFNRIVHGSPPVVVFDCVADTAEAPSVPRLAGIWRNDVAEISIEQTGDDIKGYWRRKPAGCMNDLWFVAEIAESQLTGKRYQCMARSGLEKAFSAMLTDDNSTMVTVVQSQGIDTVWELKRVR